MLVTKVQNVVFDLGGVVLHWSPAEILRECFADEATRETVRREVFQHPDWQDLDRGTLLEPEAIQRFHRRTGRSVADMSNLLQTAKSSLMPIAETQKIIQELAAHGVPLYCLSNMAASTADHLRERHAFFKLFRGVVISGEIKLLKPDHAIFEHLVHRFGLEPKDTVFIDDHLPNIEGAGSFGLNTHHFTDPGRCRIALRTQFGLEHALAP